MRYWKDKLKVDPTGAGLWTRAGPARRSTLAGRPNRWLTLDALRVVKLLHSRR
jgi:hypothetical protein